MSTTDNCRYIHTVVGNDSNRYEKTPPTLHQPFTYCQIEVDPLVLMAVTGLRRQDHQPSARAVRLPLLVGRLQRFGIRIARWK